MALGEWDPRRGRQGRAWRALVKAVCTPDAVCQLCYGAKGPIMYGLRHNHPLGPSVDHIIDLQFGGHPTARWNLQPAHFGCNAGKRRKIAALAARRSSRDWPPVDLP